MIFTKVFSQLRLTNITVSWYQI